MLRVPKRETSQFIDRNIEAFNEDQAISGNLAPEVIWREDSGLSLTCCIRHSRNLTKADLKGESIIVELVERLKTLHYSDIRFKGQTDIEALFNCYFELVPEREKHALSSSRDKALNIYKAIKMYDSRLVSSHNDLVLDNLLLDDQKKLCIIDWEYSALSSPYWDLATVCNSARFDKKACLNFLNAYSRSMPDLKLENLQGYCFILQLLTVLWLTAIVDGSIEQEIEWLKHLDKIV